MQFESAAAVESICYQLRLASWEPSQNRALINQLADGWPPYSEEERIQNNIQYNVNDLSLTNIAHSARRQLYNALLTPDPVCTIGVDYGPIYRRREWGETITQKLNSKVTGKLKYKETLRSVVASEVLHGPGASAWDDKYLWCPTAIGIEDVMIPDGTLLTFEDMPFFAIYRKYSAYKILSLTTGPKVDPAWNLPLVKQSVAWVIDQASRLWSSSWPEVWSPEKMEAQIKENNGLVAQAAVPTIDCWDFRFWSDTGKTSGWRRRIVLDAWGEPGIGGVGGYVEKPSSNPGPRRFDHGKNEFLFNSGDRVYSPDLWQQIHFQFADCSAVPPFRYHSTRGVGFLNYNLCQIQNRLKCSLTEAAAEALLQYFRVHSLEDAERAIKVNLINRGIIPDGVEFVPPNQRWTVNQAIVELVIGLNRQSMADNSASFTQDFDLAGEEKRSEETATRTMAKVNASSAMVGSMIQQAYMYHEYQLREICRRFCIKNSRDADVRWFRLECLKAGVPEEALDYRRWNVEVARIIGSGNKTMQAAIAQRLWSMRPVLEPGAQKKVDRLYIAAFSDDWNLAKDLIPDAPHVTDSVHDAQNSFGTLMEGVPVTPKPGLNPIEVVETLLAMLAAKIQQCEQMGNMATADQIRGFQNTAQYIGGYIQMLAQDKSQKQRVKVYGDDLGKLGNVVKGFAQRLAQQQEQASRNGASMDPKDMAKIQGMQLQAMTKARLGAQSHAMKTAQRQITWEKEEQRRAQEHRLRMHEQAAQLDADLTAKGIETLAEVRRGRVKSLEE